MRRVRPVRPAQLMSLLPALIWMALGLPVLPLDALDWPVKDRILTGTFGEDRNDHFHLGIDLGGGEQEVRPVLGGELVFRYDEGDGYSSLPRGLGTFVVLHHSQNILSFYCHLQKGSPGPIQTAYTPSDRIGIIGDTGHSDGKHLHFAVYDEEAGSWINPLSILPPLPDAQAPVIKRVLLSDGEQHSHDHRRLGHRQHYTQVRITSIGTEGKAQSKPKARAKAKAEED